MSGSVKALTDDAARLAAITRHDRSLLIEAGAGSGKTAVMAGRIAMMLASGIAPKSIAAVTFTELAASELLVRVRDFVSDLLTGHIASELRIAFPHGLSEAQRGHLLQASATIDEITCSTIHGFCQRLIKPYPVEADIDPGAAVLDRNQADLVFIDIVDSWLRERLSVGQGGLIAEMVLYDPGETVGLIHKILGNLRRRRTVIARPPAPLHTFIRGFEDKAAQFVDFIRQSAVVEDETAAIAVRFREMGDGLAFALAGDEPTVLVRLLVLRAHPDLCTKAGAFSAFKRKGKWVEATKRAGLAKADGERLNALAEGHYQACCEAWEMLLQNTANRVLADLVTDVRPVMQRFRDHKRSAALLDFDDLIFAARDLLRDHDDVRRALGRRYACVLVDEFQDTDPLQTEIFWRLCGEPPAGGLAENWSTFNIRPGALFLVGDPKQAIYRFRGADVMAYVRARDAFKAQGADSVLSISTNFRSCAPILTYVNDRFESVLSSVGQPGFTRLDPFIGDRGEAPCVAALDVAVANEDGKASAEQQRDGEAEAVAEMCARLIGSERIMDRKSGESRLCRPGDIALLAPTGNDLWRYEEALERHGIPVATQAGKGLFRRQEVQDLIALTRVLADQRDTLALGALLRGPLVGLTEEELLDVIWSLPRFADDPQAVPRLDLGVEPETIQHPLARDIFEKLQALRQRANATTPYDLLSQAVDVLRVRPLLIQRHRGQAERALANVDLYLSLAQAYSIRGLRSFSEAMTAAWTDESRAVEGRPDAQEEAVALYTMHASKGLEWPIVVPINTMTAVMSAETAVTDRDNDYFYCPILGVKPVGYDEVREAEKAELNRERIRLWYVAATRARELLVIPRLDASASRSAWIALLDLSLTDLPALDLEHFAPGPGTAEALPPNNQTRAIFAQEAATIANKHQRLIWVAPSRDEGSAGPVAQREIPDIIVSDDDMAKIRAADTAVVQGSRDRGLVIHKLLEEVLTGEIPDHAAAVTERAGKLIQELGHTLTDDPANGLSSAEIADCVLRALAIPEIAVLRPVLVPEFPVCGAELIGDTEQVTAGIVDATSFAPDGSPQIVVDWKSDVNPAPNMVEHYRAQVEAYLRTTNAERGLIVFVTSGIVVPVAGARGSRQAQS